MKNSSTIDPHCPWSTNQEEDVRHVMRWCLLALSIWVNLNLWNSSKKENWIFNETRIESETISEASKRMCQEICTALLQCSVFDAELRGALDGLHHAWSLGATKVILELDKLAIVRVIKGYEDENHPLGVFRQIKHLLQKPWDVRVQHYHRE
ncbi:hypothetical protein Goari_015798 [Gossypium aridum]|uniref:RNase H type-1 domain-containing protein n=1 Tax=Gossypium aridum TaxID=34290 RepID=A0A7J8WGL0_GOSAI|nr:hypothetical protein [Gossypium aridum]